MKPQDKAKKIKECGDVEIRSAVTRAIAENKVSVVIDGRPCSIEVSKNYKGELSYTLKLYTRDAQEIENSIPKLKQIEDKIKSSFINQ
jgi:hypothetical protein